MGEDIFRGSPSESWLEKSGFVPGGFDCFSGKIKKINHFANLPFHAVPLHVVPCCAVLCIQHLAGKLHHDLIPILFNKLFGKRIHELGRSLQLLHQGIGIRRLGR